MSAKSKNPETSQKQNKNSNKTKWIIIGSSLSAVFILLIVGIIFAIRYHRKQIAAPIINEWNEYREALSQLQHGGKLSKRWCDYESKYLQYTTTHCKGV